MDSSTDIEESDISTRDEKEDKYDEKYDEKDEKDEKEDGPVATPRRRDSAQMLLERLELLLGTPPLDETENTNSIEIAGNVDDNGENDQSNHVDSGLQLDDILVTDEGFEPEMLDKTKQQV